MCLLTFIPEYTTPDIDSLTNGAYNNPDGFGFAVHAGTSIIHNSGLDFDRILQEFLDVRAKHSGPALFHSRITTHGGTTVENCHPFQVGRDTQTVMAHNGMLPIKERDGKSDTRIYAEEMIPQMGGSPILNSKKMRKKMSKFAAGSKLVFLSANPDVQNDYTIINEDLGAYDADGVWWSNTSYKYARYTYSGSGMYTSGWTKQSESPIYVPKEYADADRGIVDCSYREANGEWVWAEMWTCSHCDFQHYFDEDNIDTADLCPQCDACWFCESERLLCSCYERQSDLVEEYRDEMREQEYAESLAIGNYDQGVIDFF
jgi:predicted glutamine amidotransferase